MLDKQQAHRQARRAMAQNQPEQALSYFWQLVDRGHVVDPELHEHLRDMAACYVQVERPRAALAIHLFRGEVNEAAKLAAGSPLDLARCAQHVGNHDRAARYFEEAGWLGHAAIELEDAGNFRAARVLWEQLADDHRLRDRPYEQGLVRFNLAKACNQLEDRAAGRRAAIQAMHLLEAAADGFETQGMRERAFDCYGVLISMGRKGSFENLAEGYLNSIRILREDNLRYYVLQYFEDFQELAVERGELHAAATLFREAADYARRHSMPYARFYQNEGAKTHLAAARRTLEDGGTAELAENAYAAAIDAFNELGLFSQVRAIYGKLAELDLSEKRKERYKRLQIRLAEMPDDDAPMSSFPAYLRMDTAYPEIWRLDVIEWEQAGNPAETMAEVIRDRKWPDFTRRRALLCALRQLGSTNPHADKTLEGVASYLGKVEIYAALSPLEAMFESESVTVRTAAMRAVRQLFFKRSFVLVIRGLADDDASVRSEAREAVGTLHFNHAFDPLSRIYRETSSADVRYVALESIGKIPNVQAIELLIDVLRHGDPRERDLARDALVRTEAGDVTSLLQRAAAAEVGANRVEFERVLRQRGAG